MRRASLMLVVAMMALALSAGVAGAAVKFGTEGRDFLRGTNEPDVLYGKGGPDGLVGRKANDVLHGGDGPDFVLGSGGDDVMHGSDGRDFVFGGGDDDIMHGGNGRDFIGLGPQLELDGGSDTMYGGNGNDEFVSVEFRPRRDLVFCGGGRDRAFVDDLDLVGDDCERVYKPF